MKNCGAINQPPGGKLMNSNRIDHFFILTKDEELSIASFIKHKNIAMQDMN